MNDARHIDTQHSYASCGILEISRFSGTPERCLYGVANDFYHPSKGNPEAFVLWSDYPKDSNGAAFAELLIRKKFGFIVNSSSKENPKTGNLIKVWVWEVDHEKFKTWWKEERIKMLDRT